MPPTPPFFPSPRIVLLVDDDPTFREALGTMMRFLGIEPVEAGTGEEALDLLTSGLEPWLVLLDLDMPGMGGLAALPLMKAIFPTLPVLICTGRVSPEAQALTRSFGRVGLFPKPFGFAALRELLLSEEPWRHVPEVEAVRGA